MVTQHVPICRVENVVMEYSPGVYENPDRWGDYADNPNMLAFLLEQKFTILHVRDRMARMHLMGPEWDQPMPSFEEVLMENLAYDLQDAKRLKERTLGCPKPDELPSTYA